jgi:uncharacterized membrane protein
MSAETAEQSSVIVVNFEQDASAYEALTDLKELDGQGQVQLRAAAVVVREQRRAKQKSDVESKIAALKSKVHGHKTDEARVG